MLKKTISAPSLCLLKSTLLAILFSTLLSTNALADEYPVKITADIPFIEVSHNGTPVVVNRIQDTNHKLVDDFAKTSRKCPPFCVQPMSISADVKTIGEIELLDFMKNEVTNGKGILVDARMPKFYQSETIPSSINIPFVLFKGDKQSKVLNLLGAKSKEGKNNDKKDGEYDFSDAKKLAIYCNGPWCGQSPTAIKALIKAGYPESKLLYYRGGMQLWKIFSLTTVLPELNVVTSDAGTE